MGGERKGGRGMGIGEGWVHGALLGADKTKIPTKERLKICNSSTPRGEVP